MPYRRRPLCREEGCSERAAHGHIRCKRHYRTWRRTKRFTRRRSTSSRRRRYGPAWRALRAQVLAEEPFCRSCGSPTPATDVDHITPKRIGGTDARYNLQGLCKPCHSAKTLRGL
ncbi:MAG: HNH endonuclease [Dehalococcoidia bacterium]|nr:HNH endonuclease [Dehalococcoidia bacterium]